RKKNEKQFTAENKQAEHNHQPHNNHNNENTTTDVRTMTSVSIQDRFNPESIQLLSSGDVPLILSNCTHYWDGTKLHLLQDDVKQQLMGIFQQWNHLDLRCVGFGYSPVLMQHAHYFLD